jgi:hypothetical protein
MVNNQKEMLDFKNDTGNLLFMLSWLHSRIWLPRSVESAFPRNIQIVL